MLSLVGLIIIAMLGTCVEAARFAVCARQGASVVMTSSKALLTEYSRPLQENYGLFFLESTGKPYERVIAEYAGDSLGSGIGYTDFLSGELKEISVTDRTRVGDDEAEPLQKEINEYMKREAVSDTLTNFLNKTKKFSDIETQAEQIEDTVKEQKEDTKLDNLVLRLMYLVDGVHITKKGKISVAESFAKKFATVKDYTGSDFGVWQSTVWNKIKSKINSTPVEWKKIDSGFVKTLNNTIEVTKEAIEEGKKLKSEYNASSAHSDMAARIVSGLGSLDGNLRVLNKTKELLSDNSISEDELKERLNEVWKDYDTHSLSFDYTGADSAGDSEDPMDSLGDASQKGILKLVCEDYKNISELGIDEADKYASYYKENVKESADLSDRVDTFAKDEEISFDGVFGSVGKYGLEEFSLDSYITKVFSSYVTEEKDSEWKNSLNYGPEYVVSGRKSDKENLESVLNRILLMRTVVNFGAIMADSSKRAESYAAAAGLVGFTGLTFLIRLTQTLIIITWSIVESLTDIAALLLEKDVSLVKTPTDVKTTFPEIFLITNTAILARAKKYPDATTLSFGYKEYLCLFMMMTPKKLRRYRVMDLIESSMRKNGYTGFSLGDCVFSIEVDGVFRFPAKFFRMPAITQIIDRDITGYESRCHISVGYL